MIRGGLKDVADGASNLVEMFNRWMLTYPVPGTWNEPSSWFAMPAQLPSGSWWRAVVPIYLALSGFVTVPLFASAIYTQTSTSTHDKRAQRETTRKILVAAFMVVFGLVVIIPFGIHASNQITLALAPNGHEFLSTPGNTAKLGIGVIFGAAALAINATVVVAAVAARIGLSLYVAFLSAVWPALWVLTVNPNRTLRSFGERGLTSLGVALLIGPIQGIGLRFLYLLPLSPDHGSALVTVVAMFLGVGLIFIAFPWKALENLVPQSVTVTSSEATSRAAESAAGQQVIEQYERLQTNVRTRLTPSRFQGSSSDSTQTTLETYENKPSRRDRIKKRLRR